MAAALCDALRLLGCDTDPRALVASIALPRDGRLTPALAVDAIEALGHLARITRRTLSDLPTAVFPVVLLLKGRDACVLSGINGTSAAVIWPKRSSDAVTIPLDELEQHYAGHALLLRSDSQTEAAKTPDSVNNRHWFWNEVRQHRADYLQVVLASTLINVLALATPIFTMNVYDRVFPNAALITLWSLVVGVGLALGFDALLKWVRAQIIDAVSRRVDLAVSSNIFRHLADLRLSARTMASGTLTNMLKDFEQVRDVFSSQTLATLTDTVFAILFIAVIYYIGGPLALPPAIALGLVLVLGIALLLPMRQASNSARITGGAKNAVATEAISELETLKAVAGQGRMQARWEAQVTQNALAQERARSLATFATTVTALAQQISSVGIVVIGVYLALDGQITMGAVIAAMILSGRALAPTAALSGLFVRASFAVSTLKSLNELMAMPSESRNTARLLNAQISDGALKLDDVTLTYPNGAKAAIKDLTLNIAGGSRIGLIGPVGAGKTSVVRLLSGLYTPEAGMVLLDGLNIGQIAPAQLRAEVQLVPQEAVLFTGTLIENIAFGSRDASDQDILRAARTAGVDKIAAGHPDGFAMPIAERGSNLSGGQRQMVALARALLPRPRVLILDEPTSSMDQQSEKRFIERLRVALAERPMTLIVSTHRMGLLDLTERVVLLNEGRVQIDDTRSNVLAALAPTPDGPKT